jgi:O-methyltransferase
MFQKKNIDEFKDWDPNERYYITWKASRHSSNLDGDFVQCGVFKGEEAFYMAKECRTTLHLFDSWEGANDLVEYDNIFYEKNTFKCSVDDAKKTMSGFDNVRFYIGEVPFGFDEVEKISFLNIDLDLYKPTKISLELLWPKVIANGMVLVDFHDGFSTGAEKATNDYFIDKDCSIEILPTGKCMIVKR